MLDPPAESHRAPLGRSSVDWRWCARMGAVWLVVVLLILSGIVGINTAGAQEMIEMQPGQPVDLDAMIEGGSSRPPVDPYLLEQRYGCVECLPNTQRPWSWQLVPEGLIYHSYLAGEKEPRMGTQWVNVHDQGWLWDSTLGGRVGIVRYGTEGPAMVQGFEMDVEAAAMLRQDPEEDLDVVSVDFRAGIPLTFGFGRYQTKLAYYHLSSHLGDEFLLKNQGFPRINYVRDEVVWGHSYNLTDELRGYFEVGWAFHTDGGAKPWEFQFGLEYAPAAPTGTQGAPFLAVNGHLRQELNYSGNLTAEAGWAWRGKVGGPLMRLGVIYYNGLSPQYEFYSQFEQQIGLGVWYDF
ncbi:MAG: DUF1207 domain-containing protein [Planctomycetes bacterium]|nr:DUF1207 domain-containing protein [Planctomycetota bacterium]